MPCGLNNEHFISGGTTYVYINVNKKGLDTFNGATLPRLCSAS